VAAISLNRKIRSIKLRKMHGSDFTATLSLKRGPKKGRGDSVLASFVDGPSDLLDSPSNGPWTYDTVAQMIKGTQRANGQAVFGKRTILTEAMNKERRRAFARTIGTGTEGDFEGLSYYDDEGASPQRHRIRAEQVL
jgi:hypothetical protein